MKRLAIASATSWLNSSSLGVSPSALRLVPEVIERPALDQRAQRAEGMPETLARRRPVDVAGAEAVSGLRLVDEVVLVDAEETQQLEDGGLRRFGLARKYGLGRLDDVN